MKTTTDDLLNILVYANEKTISTSVVDGVNITEFESGLIIHWVDMNDLYKQLNDIGLKQIKDKKKDKIRYNKLF